LFQPKLIRETGANDPAIGYNLTPRWQGSTAAARQTPMGIHRGMYRNRYSFLAPSRSSAEKVARGR
jgi:hypothetical protein